MIHKTRGIVLHHFKYSESSVICSIYTETHGKIAFLIQGARKKKARIRANLLQPFFLLDLEMYYKEKRQLQKIKEARNNYPFQNIPYDPAKRSIALFLAEVLHKSIHSEEADQYLFEFIFNHIQVLDLKESGLANFHLYFIIQLTKFLGFFPMDNYDDQHPWFDLKKGQFTPIQPFHKQFLPKEESYLFHQLMKFSNNQHEEMTINRHSRSRLLEKTLDFYYFHQPEMHAVKSLDILSELFN